MNVAAEPGRILRQTLLGSEAVYRVVAESQSLVEVQVVSAPGLGPGDRVHFTAGVARRIEASGRSRWIWLRPRRTSATGRDAPLASSAEVGSAIRARAAGARAAAYPSHRKTRAVPRRNTSW